MKKITVLCLLVFGLASNTYALDIAIPNGFLNLYGSIKLNANYQMLTEGGTPADIFTDPNQLLTESTDLLFGLQENSWLGIDATFSRYFAKAEISILPSSDNSNLFFRQLYAGAIYKYASVLVGRTITDAQSGLHFNDIFFNLGGLSGMGTVQSTIRNVIQVSSFNFTLSIVDTSPDLKALHGSKLTLEDVGTSIGIVESNKVHVKTDGIIIPRFDLAYKLNINEAFIKVFGTFGMFGLYDEATPDNVVNVISATGGVVLNGSINPGFGLGYLTASAFFSLNGGMTGQVTTPTVKNGVFGVTNLIPVPSIVGGELTVPSVITYGFSGSLQYFFTPSIYVEVGGGYQKSSSDSFIDYRVLAEDRDPTALVITDITSLGIYVQASFEVVKGLYIIPQGSFYSRTTSLEGMFDSTAILVGAQIKYQL